MTQEEFSTPIVSEQFADNGEHSHWHLIGSDGEILWSSAPEETITRGQKIISSSTLNDELRLAADEREVLVKAFDEIRKSFEGRDWIMEGRGMYPYNDDRYKLEVKYLFDEFKKIKDKAWANIKSKTFEYKNRIIADYAASKPVPVLIHADNCPLCKKSFTYDQNKDLHLQVDLNNTDNIYLTNPIQDSIWASRRWNKEGTSYEDLSGCIFICQDCYKKRSVSTVKIDGHTVCVKNGCAHDANESEKYCYVHNEIYGDAASAK